MQDGGFITIARTRDDTPASKARIKVGDLIIAPDAKPVMAKSLKDALYQMHGPSNSKVTLTIRRDGVYEPLDTSMRRRVIHIPVVQEQIEPDNIDYVRLCEFNERGAQAPDFPCLTNLKAVRSNGSVIEYKGEIKNAARSANGACLESGGMAPGYTMGFWPSTASSVNGRPAVKALIIQAMFEASGTKVDWFRRYSVANGGFGVIHYTLLHETDETLIIDGRPHQAAKLLWEGDGSDSFKRSIWIDKQLGIILKQDISQKDPSASRNGDYVVLKFEPIPLP